MATSTPIFTVELADGTVLEDVRVLNADMIRFDMTRARHKWPSGTEAPILMLTFWVWAALTREGRTTDTWELFSEQSCVSVVKTNGDDVADPTTADHAPA